MKALMNLERARTMMEERMIDAIIVNSPHYVFYASGFRCFDQIISKEAEVYLVIPKKEKDTYLVGPLSDRFILIDFPTWVKKQKWYGAFYVKGSPEYLENKVKNPIEGLVQSIDELGLTTGRIAIEETLLSLSSYRKMKEKLPKVEFVNGTDLLKELRMIKNEEEVKRIKKATEATEKAIYAVVEAAKPGMTELELSTILMNVMIKEGVCVFYVQIGAGERGAYGAGTYPTERRLKKGDIVRVDASAEYMGYLSDICKIFAISEASDLARRYYDITFKAEQAAMMMVKPHVRASDIFHAGVEVPLKAGYSDFYRHHVGHGLGLEAHEEPILSPTNDTEILPGMVLCIEVPYYIWGLGGFAPEDTILVTEEGYELLTTPERELIIV